MSTTPTASSHQQNGVREDPIAASATSSSSSSTPVFGQQQAPPQQVGASSSVAMSAPSVLGRRRLTAPPHLMGLAAETSLDPSLSSTDPSSAAASSFTTNTGTPPSASMPSTSSSGTLHSADPASSFGSQQQQQQHHSHAAPWVDQYYHPVSSGLPSNYGYNPSIPAQLYPFHSSDPSQQQQHQQLHSIPMHQHQQVSHTNGESPEHSGNGSPEFAQTFYDPFQVKHRRRTTAPQLKVLEAQFATNPKPDIPVRKSLAEELGMTPREVQVWFQNRRAKSKRLEKKAQAATAEGSGAAGTGGGGLSTGGGGSPSFPGASSNTDRYALPPAVPEPPRMSERQRSEQHYFQVLAKAEQQATASANAQLPQTGGPAQSHPDYYKLDDPASGQVSPHHHSQLLSRRMTVPAEGASLGYQGLQVPVAAYPPAMWQPQSLPSHLPSSQQPSPQNYVPGGASSLEDPGSTGAQPSLARLHIPGNESALVAGSAPNYLPGPYTAYRSPLADPFSPASQSDGVSPGGVEGSAGYFPQPTDYPASAFPHPDDLYYSQQRRQHSSGSISSTGDSSNLSYDLNTGAVTPTSSLSFSTAATTPTEYLPPGFDPNSRRASCPAEFIASFEGMSMPQQYAAAQAPMVSFNSTSQPPYNLHPQYAQVPVGLQHPTNVGALPSPRRHSIAVGSGAVGGHSEDYSFMPPNAPGAASGSAVNRSPGFAGQRTLTPGHLDPIAEAPPHVHQPRALSPRQAPPFLDEANEVDSPKEELKSDNELLSPIEPPASPMSSSSKKGAGAPPNTARKQRSSSSVRSVYKVKSSDQLQ